MVRRRILDPVDEAGSESFPASDPPSWIPLHVGGRSEHSGWNEALEAAARIVERSSRRHRPEQLSAEIRALKRGESAGSS